MMATTSQFPLLDAALQSAGITIKQILKDVEKANGDEVVHNFHIVFTTLNKAFWLLSSTNQVLKADVMTLTEKTNALNAHITVTALQNTKPSNHTAHKPLIADPEKFLGDHKEFPTCPNSLRNEPCQASLPPE